MTKAKQQWEEEMERLNSKYNLDCYSDSELDSKSDEGEKYHYEHGYETLIWEMQEYLWFCWVKICENIIFKNQLTSCVFKIWVNQNLWFMHDYELIYCLYLYVHPTNL